MRWSSVASSLCVLLAALLVAPAVAPVSVAQEPKADPKAKTEPPKAAQPDPKTAPDPKAKAPDPKAKAPDPKAKAPDPKTPPKAAPAPKEQEYVEDAAGGRLLLARRELTKNADGVYIVATESKLAAFVENLPEQKKQIATADGAMSKFHRDYRTTLQDLVQLEQQYQAVTNQMKVLPPQQKTAAAAIQKGVATKKSEAAKALGMMPQHHNTHELMVQQARKGYIDGIMAGKKQAGEVTGLYDKLKKDPLVEKSLKLMSAADGKTYTLGPGAEFKNQLEKLSKAESQLVKSEIDLEQDDKVWLAEVQVNGKQKHKFQVSPTSKLTLINNEMASQMGVQVHPSNPKSPFNISKDERVSVPEVVFPSLVLDDIKATNVRVLLVPKDSAPRPILGSSFFNGMIYKVDPKAKKLLVTRVKD